MAIAANTALTYDDKVIREDLAESYDLLTPTKLPFQAAIGSGSGEGNTLFEWPVVELADPDDSNRVIEGDSVIATNTPTRADRLSNIMQISVKKAVVSDTEEHSNAAAKKINKMNTQIMLKTLELKRDIEVMLLSNVAAAQGNATTARITAGMPAFIKTNVAAGVGGVNPTLSGGADGYPDAPATAGTPVLLTEKAFNDVIEMCWNEGASPTMALVNGGNKRRISEHFAGIATSNVNADDRRSINVIDYYVTDFGEIAIVPTHFLPTNNAGGADDSYNVLILDPEYASVDWYSTIKHKTLARTGLAESRSISGEYGLRVDNEKAHGIIRDTTNAVA